MQRVAALELECEGLKARVGGLQVLCKQHENCPAEEDFLSLQAQCGELVEWRDVQTSHIAELEGQLEQYAAVIRSLQETSVELQNQAEAAAEQLEELGKDVALKERHIQSLEGIIERLEAHMDPAADLPPRTDILTEDVQRLSKTLELVRAEYLRLEKTVRENESLGRKANEELRQKEEEFEINRRQSELELARLRARVELLTAENQRLQRSGQT